MYYAPQDKIQGKWQDTGLKTRIEQDQVEDDGILGWVGDGDLMVGLPSLERTMHHKVDQVDGTGLVGGLARCQKGLAHSVKQGLVRVGN